MRTFGLETELNVIANDLTGFVDDKVVLSQERLAR